MTMTQNRIRVAVAGAGGRMGQEVVKMVNNEAEFEFVVGIDPLAGKTENTGSRENAVPYLADLQEALLRFRPDVLVDFTNPQSVYKNIETALETGTKIVVGTTGLSPDQVSELDKLSRERGVGLIIAPNFAIGAVLMMKFAAEAAKYLPHVEIIELHHDQKVDAPSGTAIKTAELIQQTRSEMKQGHPEEKELIEGARGAYYQGFRIHSLRLPGLVAHQEVIFGGTGQTLTIRHDSLNRESFMPGVNLAIKRIMHLNNLVYGLENVLD